MNKKYLMKPDDIPRANRCIREIKDRLTSGEVFTVEFGTPKEHHTDSQRGYYWAMIQELAEHLGMNAKEGKELIHRECKCRAFGIEKHIKVGGAVMAIPAQSSATASKNEYSRLIEELVILASEVGYTLPPPNQEEVVYTV